MVEVAMINPEMMIWAREYAGFTGKYEKLLPDQFKLWETGEKYPTWNELRKVSKKYNLPTAFFFMNKVPENIELPDFINFRKLNNDKSISPTLIKEIRKSQTRRENYLDLLFELNENIPEFKVTGNKLSKNEIADYICEKLGVSINQINNSSDINPYDFLNESKKLITEKMGVLVFETEDVILDEMSGLCIFHEKIPIILLNTNNSVDGRIFSLFHELTHLMMGESAVCDNNDLSEKEIFCNNLSDKIIEKFHYSTLNLNNNYKLIDNIQITENSHGCDENLINSNGEYYCWIVLKAYETGIISSGEFTKFTGIGKKFIPDLQKRFNSMG